MRLYSFSSLSRVIPALVLSVAACGGTESGTAGGEDNFTGANGVDPSALPSFPKIDLSISQEVNLNRDFVAVESTGIIDFTNNAGVTEDMVLGLTVGGNAPVNVTVPLTAGEKQADVLSALKTALAQKSFIGEIALQNGGFTKFVISKAGTAARPAPKRDLGNLSVVFKAVNLAEQGNDAELNDGPTQVSEDGHVGPRANPAFAAISPDLKNFLTLGSDSLTHYEAQKLGIGLGIIHEPGEAAKTFRSGDRIVFDMKDGAGQTVTTRGIVMSAVPNGADPDELEVLTVVGGKYVNVTTDIKVRGLIAGALIDNR